MNNYVEIENIISKFFTKSEEYHLRPTDEDWNRFCQKFNFVPPDDFVSFIEICSIYDMEWQFLSLTNDTENEKIEIVYDHEMKSGEWESNYIPFHDIGNGDFYCLSIDEGKYSKIYYYNHSSKTYMVDSNDMLTWVRKLEEVFGE